MTDDDSSGAGPTPGGLPAPSGQRATPTWTKVLLAVAALFVVVWAVGVLAGGVVAVKALERHRAADAAKKPYVDLVAQVKMPAAWNAHEINAYGFESDCGTCALPQSVARTWDVPAGLSIPETEDAVNSAVGRNLSWTELVSGDGGQRAVAREKSAVGFLTYDIQRQPDGATEFVVRWGG